MTAIRAVAPAAEEVMVIRNRPSMLSGKGAGYGPRFGCTTLTAALWLLGSGPDEVFVGRLGRLLHLRLQFLDPSVHPRGQCGILRIPPYDREQRMSDLDGILVMQNKLSYRTATIALPSSIRPRSRPNFVNVGVGIADLVG